MQYNSPNSEIFWKSNNISHHTYFLANIRPTAPVIVPSVCSASSGGLRASKSLRQLLREALKEDRSLRPGSQRVPTCPNWWELVGWFLATIVSYCHGIIIWLHHCDVWLWLIMYILIETWNMHPETHIAKKNKFAHGLRIYWLIAFVSPPVFVFNPFGLSCEMGLTKTM